MISTGIIRGDGAPYLLNSIPASLLSAVVRTSEMSIEIQENVSLAPLTTLGVGGPAKYFVEAATETALVSALSFAKERELSVFILGGGSNVLVADEGFDGIVIHIRIDSSEFRQTAAAYPYESDRTNSIRTIRAGAGENWDDFVRSCVENDLAGVECLSGIPGYIGGTPVQNVGAYGQEVSETIMEVHCVDRETLKPVRLTNAECGFEYRKSIFNSSSAARFVICEVTYGLRIGGKPKIIYKELIERFRGREPSLTEVREAVLAIRKAKSMVIDPADPNSRSVGSFFKNPIVPKAIFEKIARNSPSEVPFFLLRDGFVKIPAAWLIEAAGVGKGFVLGNAGVSENHSLAIVNRGGATTSEIISLKQLIQSKVLERFGIELMPEPVLVGFNMQV